MAASPQISAAPPDLKSQNFEFLREEGLNLIQNVAANTWTDHNLHDPGITIWEAICYALTETGLRAGMEIKDLVASSATFHAPEFFTAAQVLPTAPVKLSDFQKLLISHPLVSSAWVFPISAAPHGRLSVLLEFANDELNNAQFVRTYTTDEHVVEIAFPHWDEAEVSPLQEDVILQLVTFEGLPGDEWKKVTGATSYLARIQVDYDPPVGGPQTMELLVVATILTEMEDSTVEAPIILQEALVDISTLGDNSDADQSMLKQLNRRVTAAYKSTRTIKRFLIPYRNLCENIVAFNAVRLQEVGVSARLEVNSGVNIEELLSEIYYRIYRLISPAIRFTDLDEQLRESPSADTVFDGPLMSSGFLSDASLGDQAIREVVHASDILRIIYQLRNPNESDVSRRENINTRTIIALQNLSLSNYMLNVPITIGARDCLRLVNSKKHVPRLSLAKSNISVYRNGIEIGYNRDLVSELLKIKLASDIQEIFHPQSDLPVPYGDAYPVKEFYPIQNDLPVTYGVGEAGLPERATEERIAKARQLKGYMFPFEQMLAGNAAQLSAFNKFFSADPNLSRTLFQQPLYHIPDIAFLFKSYNGADPLWWPAFKGDNGNPYMKVLQEQTETEDQFLERRNAMLDHLLATLGEDMDDRAGLLLRMASDVPEAVIATFTNPVEELVAYQNLQKQHALQELILDKSAYYYDLPNLNRDKAQATGHPLWRAPKLFRITPSGNAYEWSILDLSGNTILMQDTPATSIIDAITLAEQAITLATREEHYTIRLEGTNRRLEIKADPSDEPLAISFDTYPTDPLAALGIQDTIEKIIAVWTATTLTALERRLYHMIGIEVPERRRLINSSADHFEIFDAPDADPLIDKRIRLWSESGFTGVTLLESVFDYEAPTDPAAEMLAEAGIQLWIQQGSQNQNYTIDNTGPSAFQVSLLDVDGTVLARSAIFPTKEDAREALENTRNLIYRLFSAQGFYILENHLLFPPDPSINPELSIAEVDDPYSFQITVILPSGLARDFTDPDAVPVKAHPYFYSNNEFRKYAETQIRKHCPAQVVPRIIWADRVLPGEAINPLEESFDAFEQAYLAWYNLYVINEEDEAVIGPARDALTEITQLLYDKYYAE